MWDWSLDELAAHDLPAMVELVYSITNSQVFYVGYSQVLVCLLIQQSLMNI
jgi:hypothetical protein